MDIGLDFFFFTDLVQKKFLKSVTYFAFRFETLRILFVIVVSKKCRSINRDPIIFTIIGRVSKSDDRFSRIFQDFASFFGYFSNALFGKIS